MSISLKKKLVDSQIFKILRPALAASLNRTAALFFPAILVACSVIVLLWQGMHPDAVEGAPVLIKVWEQPAGTPTLAPMDAWTRLEAQESKVSWATHLSTNEHWISIRIAGSAAVEQEVLDFPSRHASSLTCWERGNDVALGAGTRAITAGDMFASRAGFGLKWIPRAMDAEVLCKGAFRGPAKISASIWQPGRLAMAQEGYQKTGTMIEAGVGILAAFMLLTALINRSWLYWAFVGWLLLNMRMAGLSAGTDFELFGLVLQEGVVIFARKWTVCMYFAMTAALFSVLFKKELREVKANIGLAFAQALAVGFMVACVFLSYEQMLVGLWVGTTVGVLIILYYLFRILRHAQSRMAYWYAASLIVTLLASFNEVIAASLGQGTFIHGLNSVTAALASALLASAAVAEHMRMHRMQRLEAQETLRAAYEGSPIGLFTVRGGDQVVKANHAFQTMIQRFERMQITRLSQVFGPEVVGALKALANGSQSDARELEAKVHDAIAATDRWFSIKASTVDGSMVEGSLQDITDRVVATDRLEFLANHDPLTECLNLRGIARQFSRMARQPTALAYFDLDRFKLINDLYGHSAGDEVLQQVCARIKSALGADDLLARVGGDEFVVAFTNSSIKQAEVICKAIVALIATDSYQIKKQSFALSVSGGLVGTDRFGGAPLKEIISAADTLCRIAKKRSTQRLIVMESDDRFFRHHKEELEVISYLEQGIAPKGLFLVMQPEISLTKPFDSLNFEVLLRMRKADGTIVPAGIIIEAAEAHGKSAIIDRWVMTTAMQWMEDNAAKLTNTRFISVNLSGGSLNDETFLEELFLLFEAHPVALTMICIEITETVALTDMGNMQKFIDRARRLGAKVALDDFGAGYSSFGYLKGLSVDALKLDGSLVRGAANSPAGLAIIDALGGLVNNLGMKSIGEYAENLQTIKALASAGIDYAQGYGISKPVLPEQILAATSSADFIEDPEILAFVKELQSGAVHSFSVFGDLDSNNATMSLFQTLTTPEH